MKTLIRMLGVVSALTLFASPALSATVPVVQEGRAFVPGEITIHAGDTVAISNKDEFIHQIYIDSDKMSFDSDEKPPGQSISIVFPKTGDFNVRCHIHPKMLLVVHVK
jgi:plastocyanin